MTLGYGEEIPPLRTPLACFGRDDGDLDLRKAYKHLSAIHNNPRHKAGGFHTCAGMAVDRWGDLWDT